MELFRISESTVIRWEKKGLLKRFKLPGSRKALYRKEDIEKLIRDIDGTYKPTRKGIAVKVELIDDLLEALKEFKRIEHEGKD